MLYRCCDTSSCAKFQFVSIDLRLFLLQSSRVHNHGGLGLTEFGLFCNRALDVELTSARC